MHAVDGVSLAIAEREVVGLVGESGSGKSTFGRTLVGLHAKTAGDVLLPRRSSCRRSTGRATSAATRAEIQMIFQDPYSCLNPRMTVGEIIGEGPLLHGDGRSGRRCARPSATGSSASGSSAATRRVIRTSSRAGNGSASVSRARSISSPKFVVCDEPISALDVSVQAQIVSLLGELKASLGLTMLFIAHDLSMVRYVSDRMAVMYLGSLVEIGPADDVYFRPKHPYTESSSRRIPQADPRTERRRPAIAIKGEIASPVNVGRGLPLRRRAARKSWRCAAA